MSGGSYDYAYARLDDFAEAMRGTGGCGDDAAPPALREAFREHLKLVARAMRAIEWNDSHDGDADESTLIRACLVPPPLSDALRTSMLSDLGEMARAIACVRGALEREGTADEDCEPGGVCSPEASARRAEAARAFIAQVTKPTQRVGGAK